MQRWALYCWLFVFINLYLRIAGYRAFTEERAEQLGMSWKQLMGADSASGPASTSGREAAEERRSWRESRTISEVCLLGNLPSKKLIFSSGMISAVW